MRARRKRRQMAAIDQINVTPLLDLTFLLLIVFMITMPLMEYIAEVRGNRTLRQVQSLDEAGSAALLELTAPEEGEG